MRSDGNFAWPAHRCGGGRPISAPRSRPVRAVRPPHLFARCDHERGRSPVAGRAVRHRNKPPGSIGPRIHEAMAQLPRPRKHYQWYYSPGRPMPTCELPAGRPRFPARLTTITRAPIGPTTSRAASSVEGDRTRQDADLLYYGPARTCETFAARRCHPGADRRLRWLPDNELRVRPAADTNGSVSRRAAELSHPYRWCLQRRIAGLLRPHDRRAVTVRLGQERLGRLPGTRVNFERMQNEILHRHARLSSARRRQATGCSRSRRKNQRIVDRFSLGPARKMG